MADKSIFDQNQFLDNLGQMEDIAKEIVGDFLNTVPNLEENLRAAIAEKDPKKIEVTAHTIKGAVSNLFAENARGIASQIETIGRSENIDGCEELANRLSSEIALLRTELNRFLGNDD